MTEMLVAEHRGRKKSADQSSVSDIADEFSDEVKAKKLASAGLQSLLLVLLVFPKRTRFFD